MNNNNNNNNSNSNSSFGRSISEESSSLGSGNLFASNDLSFFSSGSFDMFPNNLPLFNLLKLDKENNFSPKPLEMDNYRLPSYNSGKSVLSQCNMFQGNKGDITELSDLSTYDESLLQNSTNTSSSSNPASNSFVGNSFGNVRSTRLLPSWAVNSNGLIRDDLTVFEVISNGSLIDFAMDRTGVKFLEQNYPADCENELHVLLFDKLTEQTSIFLGLCRNTAGNFIIQKFVDYANLKEQQRLVDIMVECGVANMCLDKFACRVVQQAIQKFDMKMSSKLAQDLRKSDLVPLCTDQSAIHVIQKIVKTLPIVTWDFFVKFLCRDDNLIKVCQDKYGCRLVQQTIEKLSDNPKASCFNTRLQLLHGLMTSVTRNCYRLSSNEFANYVVQFVIKSSGVMELYRDTIIEKCLLRNLLSMSQDKYASHVVEGAFLFAPPKLLCEMMEEIFDGYVKDQETNRDALDILLFHQYGNYVVQQMISLCCSALIGKEERHLSTIELRMYAKWFERIRDRVKKHGTRLSRFSSGKKIIESLANMENLQLSNFKNDAAPPSPAPSTVPTWLLPNAMPNPAMPSFGDVSLMYNLNHHQNHSSVFDD